MLNISIIGVGKAGINIVENLPKSILNDNKILYASSNEKLLEKYDYEQIISLKNKNENSTIINDALSVSEITLDLTNSIKEKLNGIDLLILTAGFGGYTGTTYLPIIAKIARQMGIIVVAIITTPFSYEGTTKNLNARAGIEKLKENIDLVSIISNNKILNNYPDIAAIDAYKLVNNILKNCIKSFLSLNQKNAIINLNLNDALKVIKNRSEAYIGFGYGVGRNKTYRAIKEAINSKIIDTSIKNSTDAILTITTDPSMTIQEIEKLIIDFKQKSNNESLNIHFSFTIDESLRNEVRLLVIATNKNNFIHKKEVETNKLLHDSQEVLIEIENTLEQDINSYISREIYYPTFEIESMDDQFEDKDQDKTVIITDDSVEDDDIPFFLK